MGVSKSLAELLDSIDVAVLLLKELGYSGFRARVGANKYCFEFPGKIADSLSCIAAVDFAPRVWIPGVISETCRASVVK